MSEEYWVEDSMKESVFGVPEKEILFFPAGDVNIDCLKILLEDALNEGLRGNKKMGFYRHERGPDYTPENPEWWNVRESLTVTELRRLYFECKGEEFSLEEHEYFPQPGPFLLTLRGVFDIGT
jgi:hypothetical protein|tara:strand:+ start:2327 stop:2695 length:369 start_codon:yes stop_codon:yes gene_type:complete